MLVVITGPTASGKTYLAEKIACGIGGEIISADSRTLYRGIRIGTGGYSNSNSIEYHLTEILEIGEIYSVYEWVKRARKLCEEVTDRGKLPIICGGTLHYIEMFLKGMDSMPEPDENLRAYLKELADKNGRYFVHDILKKLDPALSESVHPNNLERVVRYIERAKGKETIDAIIPYKGDLKLYFLHPEKEFLEQNIHDRISKMFDLGWIDEVKELKRKGYRPSDPGLNSIGYGDIFSYLDGNISLEDARENIVKDTVEYSRRQCKWIKRLDPEVIMIEGEADLLQASDRIMNL
jgi:tRNA dimethylallyltransferase